MINGIKSQRLVYYEKTQAQGNSAVQPGPNRNYQKLSVKKNKRL